MLSKGVPVPLFLMQRNGDGNSLFRITKAKSPGTGSKENTFNVTVSFIRDQKYYRYEDIRQARNVYLWCGKICPGDDRYGP